MSWLRMVSRHYYNYTTFWGPPSVKMRLQETPPHPWHYTQFIAPSVLNNGTSTSCSCIRGIKKRLVFDLNYRSLTGTFCAGVRTGAWWRISIWQTALKLLCCAPAICQRTRKTVHIAVREKSEFSIPLVSFYSPLMHQNNLWTTSSISKATSDLFEFSLISSAWWSPYVTDLTILPPPSCFSLRHSTQWWLGDPSCHSY